MKLLTLFAALCLTISHTVAATPSLTHEIKVTPEIKKAFPGSDAIEVCQITGTSSQFEVGGTYRVTGVCRQQSLKHAALYLGNTSAKSNAITAADGSSLSLPLSNSPAEFDITFTILQPGVLHVTIYDNDSRNKTDNTHAGIYLGDVISSR